jgi:predicted transcriptional regulator
MTHLLLYQETMAPRRSQLERQVDVLKILAEQGPLRPTHLTLKANLSWQEFKRDLKRLEILGLVQAVAADEGTYFTITASAREVLQHMVWIETILLTNANVPRASREGTRSLGDIQLPARLPERYPRSGSEPSSLGRPLVRVRQPA